MSTVVASAEDVAGVVAGSRHRRRRWPWPSVVVATFWVLDALAWPLLAPADPARTNPSRRFLAPGRDHWFGTDGFGRDVFSRVLAGARDVLAVAPLAVLLAVVVGTAVGLACGYYRGLLDAVLMRLFEGLTLLPALFPVILVTALLGRSRTVLVLVIAFAFVPLVARTVRAATLVESAKQYVEAARLRSERGTFVLARELLPNVVGPVIVEATSRLGDAVFAIATLSFIGLGAAPGSPDWGAQVAENRVNLQFAWWTVAFPALAIASFIVSISLLADRLRARLGA
jgi:peptide/nickel transport system permease protein